MRQKNPKNIMPLKLVSRSNLKNISNVAMDLTGTQNNKKSNDCF